MRKTISLTSRVRWCRFNSLLSEVRMIVVRNCFTAKPGQASKLAAQMKEAVITAKIPKYRILTDLTGDFNRVILEYDAENVGEFEARMQEYATNEAFRE